MSIGRGHRLVEDLEGAQRRAATAPGNVVVAAGAGSGKTTVLAARYVRLLETGRMPSGERVRSRNVLVLTFTRKAAAEMYSRIYGALSAAAARAREAGPAGDASVARDQGLAQHLADCLAEFSQAQISTFDSFAARVARSGSSRFGIAPDFAVDEERARRMAGDLALSFILERREEEAMRDLVASAGLDGARDEVLAALAVERMSLSSPPDFEACHKRQAIRLEEMASETKRKIIAMRDAALVYAEAKTTPTSKAWLEALEALPDGDEDGFLSILDRFPRLRKPASNSHDEASLFLSDCVPELRQAATGYRDIAATRVAHPRRLSLYRLLDEFRRRWDEARRAEKTLTFRDVAQLAFDVLKADPAVLGYYRSLFRYMMIDEFQDDDELQKLVLFLLAGRDDPSAAAAGMAQPGSAQPGLAEDKLFFVGDEKQSIYLFRGADVTVFRRLAEEMSAGRARATGGAVGEIAGALDLSRNFRSEPGVIDMINAIFPSVMAPNRADSGYEDFEARFEPLEAREPTPGVEPRLVYLELPRRSEDGVDLEAEGSRESAEAEAWEVARIVRDAVERGSLLVADRKTGRARQARYEDFAVLLRSTGNQVHFEKYFRLFDVPYGAENACGLFSEAVACDLYYALRLALYPGDRNALAAYLRSPFAGLSDDGTVRILASEAEGPEALPGLRLEPGTMASLSGKDRRAWERGAATIRTLSAMADRAPICACLSYLWYEAGYRAALLLDPVASAFEEHFELVHSLAAQSDSRGECLAAFVAALEPLVGKPDKLEIELPRESSRGVRIMTIHKSKGLEFPVVIVPQANNVGQDRAARDPWYWEGELGPTFRPPPSVDSRSRNAFFEAAKERRAARESAEIKRLLYVALTRAESHIVITATEPRGEDARGRSFRSLLAASLGLFESPSPPAGIGDSLDLAPFGTLRALPSGALVGTIPERSDREYYALAAGARRRGGSGRADVATGLPEIAVVERSARPLSSSVSAIELRFEDRYASSQAEGVSAISETLGVGPGLAAPEKLPPDAWGSLVHAVLESRLGRRGSGLRLPEDLERSLESYLGSEAAVKDAAERASRLAEVFIDSDLGRRALASKERRAEMRIAIGIQGDPRHVEAAAARRARGVIDLVFVEDGRVVVIDYKTDASIATGGHELQVAAYKRAASEIYGLPAEAWVFYLYGGGRALLVDEEGSAPRLEDAPEPEPTFPRSFGVVPEWPR